MSCRNSAHYVYYIYAVNIVVLTFSFIFFFFIQLQTQSNIFWATFMLAQVIFQTVPHQDPDISLYINIVLTFGKWKKACPTHLHQYRVLPLTAVCLCLSLSLCLSLPLNLSVRFPLQWHCNTILSVFVKLHRPVFFSFKTAANLITNVLTMIRG